VTGIRIAEYAAAGVLAALGIRSLAYWLRRPLDSRSPRDQALYATYLTGRIGLWFAVAGIFLISALTPGEGAQFARRFARHRWYIMVPLGLAVLQFVGAYMLSRGARSDDR